MARLTATTIATIALVATTDIASAENPGKPPLVHHHSAGYWHWQYQIRTEQLQAMRRRLRRRWNPTVSYAIRLASVVTGVPLRELNSVAWCESRHDPFATNGRYRGLFQEGPMFERGPFAQFGVFDPIANALTAAFVVRREGWRQWSCSP